MADISTATVMGLAVNKRALAALCIALLVQACGRDEDSIQTRYSQERSGGLLTRAAFDEDAARDDAVDKVGSESFDDVGDTSQCTEDCSGHEAGFEWAKDNVGDCSGGTSSSFEEGCQAYNDAIEESVEQKREAYDAGEDED